MKKSLIVALLFGFFGLIINSAEAQTKYKTYKPYKVKTEPVRGYVKKSGQYVAPYYRSKKSKY